MPQTKRIRKRLITYALRLPEAYEDYPWGETVAKVNKKVFAFFGDDAGTQISLKLPLSSAAALSIRGAEPTGYGLGRAGWVTIPLDSDLPPEAMLREWIDESYAAVAPKNLGRRLVH